MTKPLDETEVDRTFSSQWLPLFSSLIIVLKITGNTLDDKDVLMTSPIVDNQHGI